MTNLSEETTIAVIGAVAGAVAAISDYLEAYKAPTGVNRRLTDREKGSRWLEECLEDPIQLYEETRLYPEAFEALSNWLRNKQLVVDGRRIDVEEKLLIFLYICGNGASWRHHEKVFCCMEIPEESYDCNLLLR